MFSAQTQMERHMLDHLHSHQMCTELWRKRDKLSYFIISHTLKCCSGFAIYNKELTLARAETIFPIFAIVSSRGTPWQAIFTTFSDASGIWLPLKPEREMTQSTLCIAKVGLDCWRKKTHSCLHETVIISSHFEGSYALLSLHDHPQWV